MLLCCWRTRGGICPMGSPRICSGVFLPKPCQRLSVAPLLCIFLMILDSLFLALPFPKIRCRLLGTHRTFLGTCCRFGRI
ncbi:hypothetical protein GDO81_002985 [Engystomops pustulosus]|uniref:Uncharacterized protein n=1 Tax=Engystomops pustulosus TaxID=76066 RepID=A0AAV7DQR1_ENGPU|nr:hypothetical protein GDO81_002985 [Engystomops pustulosus]